MEKNNQSFRLALNLAAKITLLTVVVGFVTRIVLIAVTGSTALDFDFGKYLGAFAIGALNDLSFAVLSLVFLMLFILSAGDWKYGRKSGWIILGLLAVATVWIGWCSPWLHDFNRGLARIMRWVMVYWTVCFAARLFIPKMRRGWTRGWLAAILFIYVLLTGFNACCEYFFWAEFAVRYNFIAVDYLVYTSEVIGNIMESYNIVPLAIALVVIAGLLAWALFRKPLRDSDLLYGKGWKLKTAGLYVGAAVAAYIILALTPAWQKSENVYYNELQANGPCRFLEAFFKNRLDYKQFYTSLPEDEARATVEAIYGSGDHNLRTMPADSIERHPNIVVITMESMSAAFMERFGNTQHLTPTLDSLYNRSLAFDCMIAAGNRTVRGLEALSLSIPPSAGQSLIKRPDLKPRPNIGSVLRDKGYSTTFLYGGKSYFDNMGPYFRSIGFDVVDIDNFKSSDIEFKNIWGVCDEDSYRRLLTLIDDKASAGKPFYVQMMTISNHRPYTYPAGRIPVPEAGAMSREGGVRYSDYALGRFLEEAKRKPWFANTVFVIVADHCASSAGETELPVENYHIPAVVYAPGIIPPQTVDYAVSQIDLMPTVLARLGISYQALFYGRDALAADYQPRAFLATYQDLGYLDGDVLTVLSPVRRVRQYKVGRDAEGFTEKKMTSVDTLRLRRAAALYQTSAKWND